MGRRRAIIAGRLASGWARREIRFGLYIMSLRTASQFANRHFWKRDQLRPDSCRYRVEVVLTEAGRASPVGWLAARFRVNADLAYIRVRLRIAIFICVCV